MQPAETRLHRAALLCALLLFIVIVASAWMRLVQPRPVCPDWPGCTTRTQVERTLPAAAPMGAEGTVRAVRVVHRVAATTALLLAIWLCVATRRMRAPDARARALACGVLAVGIGLAVLGVAAGASRAIGVVSANLLGGQAMFALCALLVLQLRGTGTAAAVARRLAGLAALLLALQALGGAALSDRGLGWPPVLHIGFGLLGACVLLGAGLVARSRATDAPSRRLGGAAAASALLVTTLGAVAASNAAAPALVVAHNASAAWALTLALTLAVQRQRVAGV